MGIEGWLWREDALKLYEMAYFARGNILELGCYHGLSTALLALALRNARRGHKLLSVETSSWQRCEGPAERDEIL